MVLLHQQFILPEFLLINHIYILSNMDVVLCCKKLKTVSFNKHMHSYEVVILNTFVSVLNSTLIDHNPLDMYNVNVSSISKKFVRMKYDMGDAEQ